MIRVCLGSSLFAPFYSGGALRFRRYAPGLRARGVELSVFAGTPTRARAEASGFGVTWDHLPVGATLPVELVDGIAVHRVRLADDVAVPVRGRQYTRGLRQHLLATRPDVAQLGHHTLDLVPTLVRLRLAGIPLCMAYTMVGERSARRVRRLIQGLTWPLPFACVDRTVVNSVAMRDALRALGVRRPIEVIPNGVDTTRFRPPTDPEERRALRAERGFGPEDQVLITVGTVSPRKGVDLLLEAFARLARTHPRLHLVIAGPRTDLADPTLGAFAARLDTLRASSGHPERVHFPGEVPDVERWLRAADVFAFTSTLEGLPNAVLEARASGLPVALTPFVGLSPELGVPGVDHLLVKRDAGELAEALAGLLADPARAAALGRAARAHIEAHGSLERALDAYAAMYHRMAKATGPGAGSAP